jgi:hypothetical protein
MGLQTTGNGKKLKQIKKPHNQKKIMALLSKKMRFHTVGVIVGALFKITHLNWTVLGTLCFPLDY